MKKKNLLIILVVLLFTITGCSASQQALESWGFKNPSGTSVQDNGETVTLSKEEYELLKSYKDKYQDMDEIKSVVDQLFYGEVDEEAMLQMANKGFLAGLGDPYTYYYTPEEYAKMWEEDKGEYAGVGMLISSSFDTLKCTISRVFRDTPAQRAGILKKDQLIRVEDLQVTPYSINEAVKIMRGNVGEEVEIEIKRGGENLVFTLKREMIHANPEEYTMLTDDVGYIALYDFSSSSYNAFQKALSQLAGQGAQGLIIDLRDNPGGWLQDALAIADIFIDDQQVITYTEYANGERQYEYAKKGAVDMPLVVLVNEYSASASELLSGALKDYKLATVVGVNSFGKGIMQRVVDIGDEGAGMQLTVAQYFTPLGNKVHEVGIAPDIEVALAEGDVGMYEFGDLNDIQLKTALEEIEKQIQNKGN